jgi:LuxR family transcriptional regulator, maltose regulon positive regulatory protein
LVQRVDRKTARPHGPSGRSASFDLCPSKLAIPAQRRGSLRRTPLVSRLRGNSEARYVSIAAPAGYGKTTLLTQWAAKDARPFAWVSLDDGDNDPVVLLSYIATALDAVEPIDRRVFRGVAAGGTALWSTAVPRLGAAIASVSTPIVIVLDDVHVLTDERSLDAIDALALHIPPGSLLVFAGRGEAALSLARYRVRGELLEIGPAELALTDSQAGALLADAGVHVSDDEVHVLNERAEGWAAGLYLAALSLQASPGPAAEQFAGDDRFVTEYLRAEHFSHLTSEEIEFLTRTAVLDRMTGSFCDAVLGRTDSAKMLAALERANLFVVALDHHSGWYRYHHLFQEMLCAELECREPELIPELHRRAAVWCVENNIPDWAVDHSSAAGDVESTATLVAVNALPLYRDGRVATLERWFAAFDEQQLLARHPAVAVFGTWVHALRGRPDDTERWALAVESSPYEGPMPDGSVSLRPWAALVRAFLCRHGVDQMRIDAELAIEELSPQSSWLPVATMIHGISLLLAGDAHAAEPLLERAGEASGADGATYAGVVAYAELALLAFERGDLDAAEAQLARGHSFISDTEPGDYVSAAILYAAEARIALAHGQGARARDALVVAQRLRPAITHALSWFGVQTTLELAHAHLELADADGARTLCLEADDLLHRRPDLGVLVARTVQLREELASLSAPVSGWASTLTSAELRLLPLLTTHLTFREIAERLFVSRNTVKTQAISVYRKLDATSRSEAIERAIELGLVDEAVAARPADFTRTG